jgi:N-acetylmuramic acid 6-phosphate etherase
MSIESLTTETPNPNTKNLDKLSPLEFVKVMNDEDKKVAFAVEKVLPQIAKAIEIIAESFRNGGRLIYLGAGTSGRLGLLDAVECVPTFGVSDGQVIGLIAGGKDAFIKAVEGAEDSKELGKKDLENIKFNKNDVLVGIAASGRTPYVLGALEYANSLSAQTIAISCNLNSEIAASAKLVIEIDAGSEVLTGSTRLKAGTAQKLILNMLSTGAMTQLGKVYGNLMVDVLMTNKKLENRAKRIIMQAAGVDFDKAEKTLKEAGNRPKTAIVMILNNVGRKEAEELLEKNKGFIR